MVKAITHIQYQKKTQQSATHWAFKRSNSTPLRPAGGSYGSPCPSSGGWTTHIPEGEERLWCVTRIFSSDGQAPQEETWSEPRPLSDMSDMEVLYSAVLEPQAPSGHPNTNTQWGESSTADTLWMALSLKRNGLWHPWQVFRTRGNDGTSVLIKGSFMFFYEALLYAGAAASNGSWTLGEYALTVKGGSPVVGFHTSAGVEYTPAEEFDAWLSKSTGDLYVAGRTAWTNVGSVRGPQGERAYIHIKYATSLTRNSWTADNGEAPGPYIGIYADNNASDSLDWNSYSWMRWTGHDGNGYEYIYQLGNTASAPAVPTSSQNQDGFVPAYWSADPVSPTPADKYCWVCYRRKTDGVWSAWRGVDSNTAALWSRYGDTGQAAVTYRLKASHESLDFHSEGNASFLPESMTLTCGYVKTVGDTRTVLNYPSSGMVGAYYLIFRLIRPDGTPDPTFGGTQVYGWDWIGNNSVGYKDGAGSLVIPCTTTYSAVEFALSSAPPRTANDSTDILDLVTVPIHKLQDGDRGPRTRGPQDWNDCPDGFEFQEGAKGESAYDIVLYNGHYYGCQTSHVKRADNYPGSPVAERNQFWVLATEQHIVATKLLMATYALVKNLGVETIDMRDADGNIMFLAKNGVVTCRTGIFDNVTVKSGKVAGFLIQGDMLTNRPDDDSSSNPDASVIFMSKVGNVLRRFAGIGSRVSKFVTGAITMGRFENHEPHSDAIPNYGLYVSVDGAARNFALHGKGNVVMDGFVEGVAYHKVTLSQQGINPSYSHLRESNRFLVKASVSGASMVLPRYQDVCAELAISQGKAFSLRLLIQSNPTSNVWRLYGRSGSESISGNDYPLWLDSNTNTISYVEMDPCDLVEILLVYDPGESETLRDNDVRYTARTIVRLE